MTTSVFFLPLMLALPLVLPHALGDATASRSAASSTALELETTYEPHPRPTPKSIEEPIHVEAACLVTAADPPEPGVDAGPPTQPAALVRARRPPVALTFDTEIPHGNEARRTLTTVLDVLETAGAHATFFVVGDWARANPEYVRRIADSGHEIANHSLTHRPFLGRTPNQLALELDRVADIVRRQTGAPIAPLFRPPYGCIDATGLDLVRARGYRVIGWSSSGRDALSQTASAAEVVAAVDEHLRRGDIILLHTNRWITATALPSILRHIEAHGLEIVTVSQLLRLESGSLPDRSHSALRSCGSGVAQAERPQHGS